MSKIRNEPKNNEELVVEVRNAIEHRATWMYLLMDEARKRGMDWDDFAREAIYNTGCIHGERFIKLVNDPSKVEEFSKVFAVGISRKVFEMEVLEEDKEKYYLDFHYCPLVKAWQKLGLPNKEIKHLCDIAMDGDRGIASQFPSFKFTLGKTIAQGYDVCQIRFDKK
jgi:hypothetical protein